MAEGPTSIHAPASSVVGTTLREHISPRDAWRAGGHRRVHVAAELTSRSPSASSTRASARPASRSARLHRRDQRAGRAGAEARRVLERRALNVLERSGRCAIVASEEARAGPSSPRRKASTSSCFDPLDGSSNIDINICIGTIFCVLRAQTAARLPRTEGALQPGNEIAAAGLRRLRPRRRSSRSPPGTASTAFTLDPNMGEFFLSHPNIRCPLARQLRTPSTRATSRAGTTR